MAGRFSGKSAILTGGAKGIGMATALRYLAEDGVLAVVDKEPAGSTFAESLREAAGANANRLSYVEAELTAESGVAAAIAAVTDAVGAPDILINNVGFGANPRPIEELGLDEWDTFMAINLSTAFLMSRAVVPMMRDKGDGRIVNLASIAGRGISSMSNLHYSTAKAAILGFTRKLAYEEGQNGIRVNAVAPGFVFTERVETRFKSLPDAEQARRMGEVPLGRAARPDEIAAAILFLASDDASYVTGAALDVNGGHFMS